MMGKGVGNVGPWGDRPPRKPKVGAGRAALAKRAKARGGSERKTSAEAARRGLDRGRRGRPNRRRSGGRGNSRVGQAIGAPVRGAAAELGRWGRVFEQRFLLRQRLRTVLLALAAVWIVWTFLVGDASLPRLWAVQRQNASLTATIDDLSEREGSLRAEVVALDGRGAPPELERIAREEHAMVRDGEVLVRFRDGAVVDEPVRGSGN